MPGKEVMAKLRDNLSFTEWELEIYKKTGYIRWESIFHFYSIDLIKAGYLRKNKRIWYLTDEGEKALQKGPLELMNSASAAYKQWHKENKLKDEKEIAETGEEELEDADQLQRATIDQLEKPL